MLRLFCSLVLVSCGSGEVAADAGIKNLEMQKFVPCVEIEMCCWPSPYYGIRCEECCKVD